MLTLALLAGVFALSGGAPPIETYPSAFSALAAEYPDSLSITLDESYDAGAFVLQPYRRTAPPQSRYDAPQECAGCILLVRQEDGSFACPQRFERAPVKMLCNTFDVGGAWYVFSYLPEGAEEKRLTAVFGAMRTDDSAQKPEPCRVSFFCSPRYKLYVRRVDQNGQYCNITDIQLT